VKELGLWAPHIPTTYGGMGLPLAWIIHEGQEATREPSGMV
jgi:alkylation response protein AidB-like acyl-CoA dehydrogenase